MTSLFLWKKKYIKELSIQLKKTGGRNNFGKIATYHRGGGTKKRYKVVNYHQNKLPFLSIIRRFEYSSNQNAYLALICYSNGLLSYILAVEGMYIGQVLGYQNLIFFDYGVAQSISNYKLGSILNNIESKQNSGGVYSRAAGTSSILLKKYSQNVLIRLSSNQLKLINNNCFATLGVISNSSFKFNKLLKAGNSV
jgi:large subunit ribosomal protein L2